jgi:hypothetical protein
MKNKLRALHDAYNKHAVTGKIYKGQNNVISRCQCGLWLYRANGASTSTLWGPVGGNYMALYPRLYKSIKEHYTSNRGKPLWDAENKGYIAPVEWSKILELAIEWRHDHALKYIAAWQQEWEELNDKKL